MKLQVLVELSLILSLVSNSKGLEWEVIVNKTINATSCGNVTVPCTFKYPDRHRTENVQLYWKLFQPSNFTTDDNDKNAFLFHENKTFVVEEYRGRTRLVGDKKQRNCSLEITNITANETKIYLRIIAKDNYSFINYPVSIILSGVKPDIINQNITQDITSPPFTTTQAETSSSVPWYIIFIPVTAISLIIIFVIGIVCYKLKRSKSFTREDSGYYANFSRASSNQAKRKELGKKQDNTELPELKAFDEPVYINLEAPAGQMEQHMDQSIGHTDNIYANMDYSQ
ncbi:sialic acid-binding Ig-like lectin 10 [Scomber scombrus]|uniref:Sialic acid-binding Ig-like lectin 10 n=2 Tax=Scomber scombrus TaxID=13677 RepID=A0AAV1NN93_SCOSC